MARSIMNAKKLLLVLSAFAGLLVLAGFLSLMTINSSGYRNDIAAVLSKQLGRTVELNGPIKMGLSPHGLTLVVHDVAIANPAWASRPQMAKIGRLELGIELLPLLHRQLVITDFNIDNADIQLENGGKGQHNWELHPDENGKPMQKSSLPESNKVTAGTPQAAIMLHNILIENSQIALRGREGGMTVFRVDKLALGPEGRGLVLNFNGNYNDTPIILNLKTDTADLFANAIWPYDADLTFGDYRLTARGHVNYGGKIFELNPYELTSGDTSLHGQISVSFNGGRPQALGTLIGDTLDPADFKSIGQKETAAAPPTANSAAPPAPHYVISDTPLDLDALKAADAAIDITIAELPLRHETLRQVTGKLTLDNGRLLLSPFKVMLGASAVQGQIKLDASALPAQYLISLHAPEVDLSDLFHLWGLESFLSGKADADVELAGAGHSLHEFASTTGGQINLTADGGTVSDAAADQISSALAELVSPGATNGHSSMNCLAARFIAKDGLVHDNGALLDTGTTIISGSGGFNLRDETIDLILRARPKIAGAGDLVPPLQIGGTFAHPRFTLDTSGTLQNLVGFLSLGAVSSGIPDITAEAGQNACVYTLDHPQASQPSNQGAVQKALSKARDKIRDLSGKLLNGIGFGQ